jgi:hypothetical protein
VSKEFQHPAIQTKIEQDFFHGAPAKKAGFYANRDPNKQEVGFTLKSFQIFKSEIKKSKTYSG